MKSELHVHRLPARARELGRSCHEALEGASEPIAQLASDLNDAPEGPTNLVFTGQYNAGKSTLIQALTGSSNITIASDVATSDVSAYIWGDVQLIDTPGVQAGVREHDAKAEKALRDSDLVVFVVSVDLFDDLATAHLRHVAAELGKRRSMVVVVNKSGTMDADPAIRTLAVQEALGDGSSVPIVITDARDYLDAQDEVDQEIREELIAVANMNGLVGALNSLVTSSGQESRLRRPFEKIIAVSAEALELATEDPGEQAARKILNRQRRLIISSRRRLENRFDSRFSDYRRAMLAHAEAVADDTDAADDLEGNARDAEIERIETEFRQRAAQQTESLLAGLRADIDKEASVAAHEVRELVASPQLDLLTSDGLADPQPQGAAADRGVKQESESSSRSRQFRAIGDAAGRFAARWGGEASVRSYAGSAGHKTVYSIGKAIGVDFKPWQAVKYAQKIGSAAKFVNKAMPFVAIGADAFVAIKTDRAEVRFMKAQQSRRRQIVVQGTQAAGEVETEVRARLNLAVADFYGPAMRQVEEEQAELDGLQTSRSHLEGNLTAIIDSCRDELALLDVLEASEAFTGTTPKIDV